MYILFFINIPLVHVYHFIYMKHASHKKASERKWPKYE